MALRLRSVDLAVSPLTSPPASWPASLLLEAELWRVADAVRAGVPCADAEAVQKLEAERNSVQRLSASICFPEVEDGPTVGSAGSPVKKRAGSRETILLVEDEDAVRRIVCTILQRHGYEVLDAASPRLACDLFAEHGPRIDLLLTDVVMPEMNGPSLAERLVAERRELRVLYMSGYVGLASPFMGGDPTVCLLNKPFQSSTLLAKVHEVLTSPRMTP